MRDEGDAWVSAATPPTQAGVYDVQTPETSCRCCWERADFRDGAWWRYGNHASLSVRQSVDVTHWRDAAARRT